MNLTEITTNTEPPTRLIILEDEFDRFLRLNPETLDLIKRLHEDAAFRFIAGLDAPRFRETPIL